MHRLPLSRKPLGLIREKGGESGMAKKTSTKKPTKGCDCGCGCDCCK